MPENDDDNLFGAEHIRVFRETKGERGTDWRGTKILLLTTTGRSSGEPRTAPLIHTTDGDRWVIVASKGGAPEHPTWYHNIVDAPLVELQDGAVRKDYTPRELSGDERAVWWDRAVEAWPAYADYQTKTDRLIPLFLLTPTE